MSSAWVREAIHARLWMQVMTYNRAHKENTSSVRWRPDLEVYRNERFESPGVPDPDPDSYYPSDAFPEAQRMEAWLREHGIVFVPDDPDDMSMFRAHITGSAPTLRASLAELPCDEDWVQRTALRYMLAVGSNFKPVYGPEGLHRLAPLPLGPGRHVLPYHFVPVIEAMTDAGFCERLDPTHFEWLEVMKPHVAAALPYFWGPCPTQWEKRKWELGHIWRSMPKWVKAKYLIDQGPLNLVQLDLDMSALYDPKTRRWRDVPHFNDPPKLSMGHICRELDRLDREDGLPGRR